MFFVLFWVQLVQAFDWNEWVFRRCIYSLITIVVHCSRRDYNDVTTIPCGLAQPHIHSHVSAISNKVSVCSNVSANVGTRHQMVKKMVKLRLSLFNIFFPTGLTMPDCFKGKTYPEEKKTDSGYVYSRTWGGAMSFGRTSGPMWKLRCKLWLSNRSLINPPLTTFPRDRTNYLTRAWRLASHITHGLKAS